MPMPKVKLSINKSAIASVKDARTLFQYISDAYLALNDKNKAIAALQEAAAIGEEIDYSIMTEYTNNKIRSIQEYKDP